MSECYLSLGSSTPPACSTHRGLPKSQFVLEAEMFPLLLVPCSLEDKISFSNIAIFSSRWRPAMLKMVYHPVFKSKGFPHWYTSAVTLDVFLHLLYTAQGMGGSSQNWSKRQLQPQHFELPAPLPLLYDHNETDEQWEPSWDLPQEEQQTPSSTFIYASWGWFSRPRHVSSPQLWAQCLNMDVPSEAS